ncbi:MAG TPA: AraC family transcriptional regulator N-terminal domain-containing protein, partial [Pseudomonadales bacterium]|nr:AraC family transcriptional regulator N-terminal domain-containing protein [Pseudomonadales bacterium]
MLESGLVAHAAFSRRQHAPKQLIENRTIYERHGAALSIYDTFAPAEKVHLKAEEMLYCGMISGRKVLYGKNQFQSEFLPHESFVMGEGETVEIDFPDASLQSPTSCLTLGISRERLRAVCDQLNHEQPLPAVLGEWQARHEQVLHLWHTEATQRLLVRIVDSFLSQDDDRDLVLNLGVTELLTRMLRQQGRSFLMACAQQDSAHNALSAVLRFIDERLDQHLEIEQLCRVACMSRSKLYEQFKRAIGCGP